MGLMESYGRSSRKKQKNNLLSKKYLMLLGILLMLKEPTEKYKS